MFACRRVPLFPEFSIKRVPFHVSGVAPAAISLSVCCISPGPLLLSQCHFCPPSFSLSRLNAPETDGPYDCGVSLSYLAPFPLFSPPPFLLMFPRARKRGMQKGQRRCQARANHTHLARRRRSAHKHTRRGVSWTGGNDDDDDRAGTAPFLWIIRVSSSSFVVVDPLTEEVPLSLYRQALNDSVR